MENCSQLERKVSFESKENIGFLKKIGEFYFKPKSIERWKNGRIYEYLGVKYIQKIIMGTIGKLIRRLEGEDVVGNYFIQGFDIESLKEYEYQTRINEGIHAPQILVCGSQFIDHLATGNYKSAIFWGSLLLLNISCTILQRYNRARLYNIIEKKEKLTKLKEKKAKY